MLLKLLNITKKSLITFNLYTMKTLFEKLSAENQEIVNQTAPLSIKPQLTTKSYFVELSVSDAVQLVDLFKLSHWDKSFAATLLDLSSLFAE